MKEKIHYTIFILLTVISIASCAQQQRENNQGQKASVTILDANQFNEQLQQSQGAQLIDVRTPEEYATGHLAGSSNIDIYSDDFDTQLSRLDKSKPVFVYCKAGGRSADAASKLQSMGFAQVYDMKGGIMSWSNKNLPMENGSAKKADTFRRKDYDALMTGNMPVLIDYYAAWCSPCKKMEPWLAKLSAEYAGKVNIVRIDVDAATALVKELNIENIPVITTHKNGKELRREHGLQTEDQLRVMIEELLK